MDTAPSEQRPAWLTESEHRTLEAVCQALIPSGPPPPGEEDRHGLYARSAGDRQVARIVEEILTGESPQARAEFKQLLALLGSPVCGVLLAGRPRGLVELPVEARERALRAMSTSAVPQLRQGFQALKRLAHFVFYAAPGEDGANPNWPALGYVPTRPDVQALKRIRTLKIDGDLMLSADVVVVGSGAGGGVIAAELAAAGKDVLILEKGGYYNETDFTGSEAEMTASLYLRRGLLTTRDLGMVLLAGSCLGGGTVVNWNTSLRTPDQVLEEWERVHGLTGACSVDYRRGFDAVEARLGVNWDNSPVNPNNAALQRGCQALGYRWSRIARNAIGCEGRCGACGYGCPYACKQSTLLTFLQDASDRGARTLTDCTVERVLVAGGQVGGVEGWAWDRRSGQRHRVVVRAPRVVAAAGAVESPALLLRSGLENPNIGRHLRLHPVASLVGRYTEPIEPWVGTPQTILCDHFAHQHGGYGVRMEVAPAHPGLIGLTTPWASGQWHKRLMSAAAHQAIFIILSRDTGEGRITLDPRGDPVPHYWPNATDRGRLVRGMQEMARIALAGGAVAVSTLHSPRLLLQGEGGRPGAVSRGRLEACLDAIAERGIQPNRMPLFSAHQMGTCRLGRDARTAVADPDGEVYGVRGLFIGDGSGFPTACGVNPMISIMGLARWVAQQITVRSV